MRSLGMFSIALISLVVSLPATSNAEGNATGNGGGVICIAGKCQTLVEAGLRLAPDFDGVWLPTSEHYAKVEDAITNRLHLPNGIKNDIYVKIFGRADHFRRVEVVDKLKLQSIKQLYFKVAAEAGFPIDPKTFKVVAFSSDDTVDPAMTYLLPDFFNLDVNLQSSILIHEGLYRGRPTDNLKFVLQLESSMEVFASGKAEACKDPAKVAKIIETCMNQPIIAHQLGIGTKAALVDSLLRFALLEEGAFDQALDASLIGSLQVDNIKASLLPEPRKLLAMGKVDPRIPYIFSKIGYIRFEFVGTLGSSYTRDDGFYSDWSAGGEMQYQSCEKDGYGYLCKVYQLAADSSLDLVLPE